MAAVTVNLKKQPDTFINVKDFKVLQHQNINEKQLSEFIVNNIHIFIEQTFNDTCITYEIEKPLNDFNYFGPRSKRIDIFVNGKNYDYIIELKAPKFLADNRKALGQLLDYGRELYGKSDTKQKVNKKLVLVTTKFDIDTALTIDFYELPIVYIYLEKQRTMVYEQKA